MEKAKKVIVVGLNHAGTTAVRTIRNIDKNVQITGYDMNDNISFLGCGIALWVKGDIKDPSGLFYANAELLKQEHIDVKMKHKVLSVDANKKEILVKDLTTGKEFHDHYDKLIVATGSWPIIPQINGIDLQNVYISKWYQHAAELVKKNQDAHIKNVIVVGGGYIGVELAEAFRHAGKNVTLIDASDRILSNYYDPLLTDIATKEFEKNGVHIKSSEQVKELKSKDGKHVSSVVTDKGEYAADLVVFGIGFRPSAPEFVNGQVELAQNGAIKADKTFKTSNKDIYAIGDCVQVHDNSKDAASSIMLATNAVRTGVVAGVNVMGVHVDSPGVQGSNAIKVFDQDLASTGVTETSAKRFNIEVETATYQDNDLPEFMTGKYKPVTLKVVWRKDNKEIIGAQIASETNHTEIIHLFSLAILKKLKITELALVDMFFLPHFNKPYNFVTQLGLNALGIDYMSNKKGKH